ncbi:putative Chain length determinant family protein [Acidobacteriia bacterium SbA2]|nr:putative Chain length determinant family protein [Acidobacteriia bacterium SbA2]
MQNIPEQQLARVTARGRISGPVPLPPALRNPDVSLGEIWLKIWKRRVAASLFASGIFLAVILYTFLKKPVYESVAQIRVDSSQQGSLGLEDLVSQKLADSDSEGGRLQTELTILQCPPVSMQVIKNLDLGHREEFAGKTLMASVTAIDPVKMDPLSREKLLLKFHDAEKLEVLPKTRVIEIRFQNVNPKLASDVVNGIVDAYLQRNFDVKYQGAVQVSEWLSKQMEELKLNAARAEQRLAEFQKQNNILGTDENNNIVIDRLRHLNSQLADAEGDRIIKEARYRLASTGNPELVAAVVPSTTLQALRMQEADLKSQYAQLDAKFGSGFPRVQELQAQLARLDQNIADELTNVGQRLHDEFLAAQNSESLLRDQFEHQRQEAFNLNASAVQFATLKHEVESSQELSDTLQLKLKEAGLMAGLASADISIVSRGMVAARPAFPKKSLMLPLGFLISVFGGLVFVFVLESFDDSLRTSEEVEAASSIPALATIPLITRRSLRKDMRGRNHQPGLGGLGTMAVQRPASLLAESYRVLCNSLLLTAADRPPQLLVVTSAFPSEGKSVSSCNLAITLAQRGSRVLLVDADLRRSTLLRQLGLEAGTSAGLSSMISGNDASEAVRKPFPQLPTLEVIAAGPQTPWPAELLASKKMGDLLEQWRTEYDHVVVDTTPLLFFADTMPLAAKADGVLLVVLAGRSRRKAMIRTLDLLARAKAHVLGMIVNGVALEPEYVNSYVTYGYSKGYGDIDAKRSA